MSPSLYQYLIKQYFDHMTAMTVLQLRRRREHQTTSFQRVVFMSEALAPMTSQDSSSSQTTCNNREMKCRPFFKSVVSTDL